MRQRVTIFIVLLVAALLAGCNAPAVTPETLATQTLPASSPVSPTPTLPEVSPIQSKYLTICLGQEPNTLYPYGNPNLAARSVLEALYDGPIDVFLDGYQPVILEDIPSLENGDAQVVPVKAKRGDLVVNTDDEVVLLDAGVSFFPAGCRDLACSQRYSGSGEVEMDQMVVTFRMKPEVLWSDGQPVTAQDSLFAFRIDSDSATPNSKYLVDRTQNYEQLDDLSVQWWGRPGFLDPTFADNFWSPLPFHAWGRFSAAELARENLEARPPLGWGPYVFENWTRGESIRLRRNPGYFRAEEKLPAFEILTFRFLRDNESGLGALAAGECDVLDSSLRLDSQLELVLEFESRKALKALITEGSLSERLDFGILPASYDDGIGLTDRPNLFADVRTRQAVAYCLNRQKVVDDVLLGLSFVPDTFVPKAHPVYNSGVTAYPFDANKGIALLEEVGWLDADKNPATPRLASQVNGVPDNTPLQVTYLTSDALQRRQAAEILSASLRECGIGVNVQHLSVNDLYAPGPGGPLFGRQFDLAAYAVGSIGPEPACAPYTESQIPTSANNWLGLNVMGYRNPDFDTLCQKAQRVLPGESNYSSNYSQLQTIFANDLPSIPLYARLRVAAARPDLCNFSLTPNALFDLWNLEEWDTSPACAVP
jgi:peptide/nickel transport system substrate-binding protein